MPEDELSPSPEAPDSAQTPGPDHLADDSRDTGESFEPVLTRARYTALVTALAPAVFGVLAAFGVETQVDEARTLTLLLAAGGLVVGAVNWAWGRVQAAKTRQEVTPTAAPRSASGEQLVTLAYARGEARRRAAEAATSGIPTSLPIGAPAPTPWAEDSSVVTMTGEAA